MKRTRLTFTDRDQWLAARTQGIGASEVATIVGLNPWETPYQLWRRKTGLDAPKPENTAMATGHILEDGVAQFWARETGREIIRNSRTDFMFVDAEHQELRVSPDRTYWLGGTRNDDNKGILECKTTRLVIDQDDIPRHWFVQVQMNLGVAGYTQGSLAWLSAAKGFEFGYCDLQFVPDFYEWLKNETLRFWHDNVLGGVEPPAVSPQDVILKYDHSTAGLTATADEDTYRAYCDLKEVRREIDALEERKADLEGKLKAAFKDAEAMAYNGETIATWRSPKPTRRFDTKRFQADYPGMADDYYIETQGARRLLLK